MMYSLLALFRKIMAFCCVSRLEHMNALYEYADNCSVKAVGNSGNGTLPPTTRRTLADQGLVNAVLDNREKA
jgi:hypothetical protein